MALSTPPPLLIQEVQIFTGEKVLQNGYVHVLDGEIVSVGTGQPPEVSPDTTILSKPGHTVLPGFIDCHIHAWMGDETALTTALKYGITTVLDMHNEPEFVRKLKNLCAEPASGNKYADFKTSGLAATIEGGYPMKLITDFVQTPEAFAASETWVKLKSPEDAPAYVAGRINEGSDYIKLLHESGVTLGWDLPLPTKDLQASIVQAAHARGLKVVAHAMSLQETMDMLEVGVDGLAHTFIDTLPTDALIEAYKVNNAWCCPTLAATGSMTATGKHISKEFLADDRVQHLAGEAECQRLCNCMGLAAGKGSIENAIQSVKALMQADIDIVCGSDSVGPSKPGVGWGITFHHELLVFVKEVGMTPLQALISATVTPARRFGFLDRGLISPGLVTDLMLVEGDPLHDIGHTLNLRGVWRGGWLNEEYL